MAHLLETNGVSAGLDLILIPTGSSVELTLSLLICVGFLEWGSVAKAAKAAKTIHIEMIISCKVPLHYSSFSLLQEK